MKSEKSTKRVFVYFWGLLLIIAAFSASAYGGTSNYPISWITFPNAYIGPNSNADTCDGGVVHRLMCRFKKFGAGDIGTFQGHDGLGNYYTVTISALDDGGPYVRKTEAWVDHSTRDGKNSRKFLTYLSSIDGKQGYVELLPDLPESTPEWSEIRSAVILEWDTRNPNAQAMTLQLMRLLDDSSQLFRNREWAMRMEMLTNVGEGIAKMSLVIDQDQKGTRSAYRLEVARDSEKTLVNVARFAEVKENMELDTQEPFECVRNRDLEVLSFSEIREDLAGEGGACATADGGVQPASLEENSLNAFGAMAAAGWF